MKSEIKKPDNNFEPFNLVITIESKEDLLMLHNIYKFRTTMAAVMQDCTYKEIVNTFEKTFYPLHTTAKQRGLIKP